MERTRDDALATIEQAIGKMEMQTTLQLAQISDLEAGLGASRAILQAVELSLVELNERCMAIITRECASSLPRSLMECAGWCFNRKDAL